MNKKILIGCIIAAVIIILASFTPVVGFQTTKSTLARNSPLFSVRTKRAINEEQDTLTCKYIGKGKAPNILLPTRERQNEQFLKVLDIIEKMDDAEFEQLNKAAMSKLQKNVKIGEKERSASKTIFQFLKTNKQDIIYYAVNNEMDILKIDMKYKTIHNYCFDELWFPGYFVLILICILLGMVILRPILAVLFIWIYFILALMGGFHTMLMGCTMVCK